MGAQRPADCSTETLRWGAAYRRRPGGYAYPLLCHVALYRPAARAAEEPHHPGGKADPSKSGHDLPYNFLVLLPAIASSNTLYSAPVAGRRGISRSATCGGWRRTSLPFEAM